MADTLGTLVVRIAADIRELEAGLNNAQGLMRTSETATKSLATATDTLTRVYRDLAVSATAYKAYEYVKDATMLAARYETLGVSMKVVGQNAGYNAAQMEAAAQGMQRMGISMIESRQQAMRLVQAHIDLADSEKLARIAQDAAVIGNMNSSEAFATMIHGIQSGQTDVLRTIGLNVNMEESYKIMAGTLGKNVDALTQNEKTQAVLNATFLEGVGIAGTYAASMDTAGKQMNSMTRYTQDAKTLLGEVFNEALTVGVMAFTDHLKESNAEMTKLSQNDSLRTWGHGVATTFVLLADMALGVVSTLQAVGATTIWLGQTVSNVAMILTHPFAASKVAMEEQVTTNSAYVAMMKDLYSNMDKMRTALSSREKAVAEKAAAELHATAQQSASYNLAMLTLQKNREAGLLKEAEFVKAVKTLWQANYGDNHHYTDTAPATKVPKTAVASEYDKLSDAIARELSLADEELKYGGKLAASDKYRVQSLDKIQDAYANGKITMQEWSNLYDAIDKTADRKLESETIEKVSKATEQANKERQSELDTIGKSTATLQDQIRAQQDHNAGIGQTAEAIADLTSQRELDKASTLQGIAIKELDRNLDYQKYDATMAEVAAMRTLAAEKARGGVLETADKSAKASADEWKKGWEETDRIAREAFTSWADGGKSASKVIGDALKKSLLSAIYEATIRPISLQLYTSITGGPGGTATAGQGGMGLLSGLSTASGLSTLGSAIGTGISGAVGSSIGAVFGTTAGNTAIGMTMGATSAESLAAASSASVAGGGVAAGEGLTAAATGLGAIPVWGWAALGVMALVGSGVFGGGGGPKTESGSGIGLDTRQASLGGPIGDYVKGLETGYANAATPLGITGTMKAGAFTAVDTAGGSKTQLQVAASVNGQTVYDRNKLMGGIENVGRTPEELAAAMSLEASRAVFAALQSSTLPKYLSGVFDGLSAGAMTQAQVDTAMAAAQSFKLMHDQLQALPFAYLQDMSYATSKTLTDLAGGMQAFGTSLATYYDKFYTTDEKTAQLTKNTTAAFADLGIVMPAVNDQTRAWYRSEVDRLGAMDLGVAANAHAYTAALALATAVDTLAPTFDSVQAAAKSTADAAIKAAQDAAKATADLAKTNQSLQDQLDILTGKQTANSIALRDATDVTTAVLLAQVDAQTKLNDATTQAASDAKALKDALTSAGGGLAAFIQTLRGATQASSLTQTRAAYNADLTLAQAGNVEASNRLPSSGKAYLDAQTALAASAMDVQRASAIMANQLSALPATQSYEQKMLDAIAATTQAVGDLNGKLVTELTVTARSEIVKAISVIGTSDLSPELTRLALDDAAKFTRVIDIAAGSTVSDVQKALALNGAATFSRVMDIVQGSDITSSQKSLVLDAASDFSRVLGITARVDMTAAQIGLAQDTATYFKRTLDLAMGTDLDAAQKALALGQATDDFNRTINALGGTLTDEQKLLLNGQTDYKKLVLINAVVATSASAAPVADQPASPNDAQYTLSSTTSSGGPYTKLTAFDKSVITWGSSFSGDVLANVLTLIQSLDTLSAPMHTAIATYGHDIGLPGFAVGTNSVPYDMTANIHKDERIFPAADNRELFKRLSSPQGNNDALVAEIKALREEVRELRATNERGNVNTQTAADRLSGRQGVPFLVQVAS